jgi:hypothetical protein
MKFSVVFLSIIVGCFACLSLQDIFPPIIAASLVGLIGSFISYPTLHPSHSHGPIYVGSFLAMSSPTILVSYLDIFILSATAALLFQIGEAQFAGIGGKLGAIAFISTSILFCISYL